MSFSFLTYLPYRDFPRIPALPTAALAFLIEPNTIAATSPTIANGVVYVGSLDDKLYAFDATCHQDCQALWSFPTDNYIEASPTVANGVVYVGTGDGKLYALGSPSLF